MKQIAIIAGGVVLGILILAFGMSFFILQKGTTLAPAPTYPSPKPVTVTPQGDISTIYFNGNPNQPASIPTGAKIELQLTNGQGVVVNNFLRSDTIATDPNIPGRYFLAGGINPVGTGAAYSIYFTAADQSFTIQLLQRPFATVRTQAELDLLGQLGIKEDAACLLKYQVVVPDWASDVYSGQNLKFDFCQGAVQFPPQSAQ